MDFFNHTESWIKGELFEAGIILAFGVVVIGSGILCWKSGTTPHARALIIPLLVVGTLVSGMGLSMYLSNRARLINFEERYRENPVRFVDQEKQRVEGFIYLYELSDILVTVSVLLAVATIWFTGNRHLQASGIGLLLFGLSLFVIDYFSRERAETYHKKIERELEKR